MASGTVAVMQDGARLRYAVPLALERAGLLGRMYTNWYSGKGRGDRAIARGLRAVAPAAAARLLARECPGIPGHKVVSNPLLALRAHRRRSSFAGDGEFRRWESDQLSRWVERRWRRGIDGEFTALFGFVRNLSPRLLKRARELGLRTIVDQMIAPRIVELRELRNQRERFPGWSAEAGIAGTRDVVADMEEETWALADWITCPSRYVQTGMSEALPGVRNMIERLVELPYPVHGFPAIDRTKRRGQVVVGFVGRVGLRKGAPYFLDVARRISKSCTNVRFEMVGPVDLTPLGLAQRGEVRLVGAVGRGEVARAMEHFDIFYFPSTCEGSAGAVMEAMATGLPVVTSPNAGSVARDEVEGFIRAYDDLEDTVAALGRLIESAELRCEMGRRAAARVREFGLESYGEELRRLLK